MHAPRPQQEGFTLLELSIVLVIIGLIIGSILVGQDMIKAAEMRATVAQVEKFNSAVNTFRGKFGGIPGDLAQVSSGNFGMLQLTSVSITGQGDNNGLLEGGSANATVGIGETITFWRHLSDANLVEGAFGSIGNSAIVPSTGLLAGDVTNVAQSLPASKTVPTQYFIAYASSGLNYFQLMPVLQITSATGAYTFSTTGLTPIQAYNMDIKLDDGMPNTGTVIARGMTTVNVAPTFNNVSTPNTCTIGTGVQSDTYNLILYNGGTDASCSLRFRFN